MSRAFFRFHEELNTFLPSRYKQTIIEKPFNWRASIKDMIESIGVPHSEIELLMVNGQSVDFAYIVNDGDQIEVYPRYEMVSQLDKRRLRPPIDPHAVRFILDTHLGRLAAYLRMIGFDTLYRNDYPDDELAEVSHQENRVLLTRDVGLLKRGIVTYGYFVRETQPKRRLREVTQRFGLVEAIAPFKYCMKCNGLLEPVEKQAVIDGLPADTAQVYDDFHQCQACQQVYWKGPHYERMLVFIQEVLQPER